MIRCSVYLYNFDVTVSTTLELETYGCAGFRSVYKIQEACKVCTYSSLSSPSVLCVTCYKTCLVSSLYRSELPPTLGLLTLVLLSLLAQLSVHYFGAIDHLVL